MKKKRGIMVAAVAALASLGLWAGVAHAMAPTTTIQGMTDHTVYAAGSTVTVSGTDNGDVICAGQTITITATVNGDVLCAGQTIVIDGAINGNVRAVGQTVDLNSTTAHSVSVVGQDVVVSSAAQVGQDLSAVGQTVTVNGKVGRDMAGSMAQLTLTGTIGRNVTAYVGAFDLRNNAQVLGNLTYTAPQVLQKSGGATVVGTTTYHKAETRQPKRAGFPLFKLYWLIAMCVMGVVLVALFPQLFRRWNVVWGASFGWALLTGFVASIVVPVGILILFASLIGAPLAILVLLLWIVAALVSMPLAAYFTGSFVVPKIHPIWMVLIGSVIIGVIELIPILGWMVGLLAYWLGIGMLLLGLKQHYRAPNYSVEAGKS